MAKVQGPAKQVLHGLGKLKEVAPGMPTLGPREAWATSHLFGVGSAQIQAGGGDGQGDAHPCELEVALPQNVGQHFIRRL